MKKIIKHFLFLTALVALFALLSVAAFADEPAPSIDMGLVFTSETQLTVYVDGEWSSALSDTYGFGDKATITAPEKSGSKTFSHWTADGSIVSYSRELDLTMNAHTTLYAVYANAAPTAKPVAGFTSIIRTNDGGSISFQAIASGDEAGIVYSTTATGNKLTIDGEAVTNVAAVKYSNLPSLSSEYIPASILDKNNCWMLTITPDSENDENADTVFHARAYVTVDGTTTYGDVKDVKLSELQSGIWMVANPGSDIDNALKNLTMNTVTFEPNGGVGATMTQAFISGQSATLNANTFTREGYTFNGWSTNKNGGGTTYTDGQSVTITADTTLYAQWKSNGSSGDDSGFFPYNPGSTPSSTPATTNYAPTISTAEHGKVSVSPTSPKSGDKVTITTKPNEGYEVDTVTVKDSSGKSVAVTKEADNTYTFTQPNGKVTINVTFKPIGAASTAVVFAPYADLDATQWYADGIRYVLENGIMQGMGNGLFGPTGTTTRAQLAQILYNMEGKPAATGTLNFTDVVPGYWYDDAIRWASAEGIIGGYGDGKFGPDDALTREQLVTILYRYAKLKGIDVSVGENTNILSYDDAFEVSDWAMAAMQWAVGSGVVNGKTATTLNPKDTATRAEIATIIMRYCTEIAK